MRLRHLQYSVRTLLLTTVLVAAGLSWFTMAFLQTYRQESALVEEVARTGGKIYSTSRKPEWLWELFGNEVARSTTSLILTDSQVTDSQIAQLVTLENLGGLYLDRTAISNEALVCLSGMRGLIALSLRRTKVSELPSLSHMKNLADLDVAFTNISMVELTGLDSLQSLNLRATQIGDECLKQLPPLAELTSLDIAGAGERMAISDRGIANITFEKFPKLKTIYLYYCDVSDAEIERLRSEFPGIRIIQ